MTPGLFARFPTLEAFCEGTEEEIGELIRSCGFYNTKSKDILQMCRMIRDDFGGKVPDTMEDLLKLPGVGRKTANLILGDVFGQPAVVTDTHCIRIAGRLGLTGNTAPEKVEQDLRAVLPPEESNDFCHRLVLHGRAVCTARKAYCGKCCMASFCKKGRGRAWGRETLSQKEVAGRYRGRGPLPLGLRSRRPPPSPPPGRRGGWAEAGPAARGGRGPRPAALHRPGFQEGKNTLFP